MKSTGGNIGRVFILRMEDGDIIPDCIEQFAEENSISVAQVFLIGGVGGGQVVSGPRRSDQMPPEPMLLPVDGAHEICAIGLIAPDKRGKPMLHIHGSLGRAGHTLTGCLRPGVNTWVVGEAVIYEIKGADVKRLKDEQSGFTLLEIEHDD
jgi:uncharacterized protein